MIDLLQMCCAGNGDIERGAEENFGAERTAFAIDHSQRNMLGESDLQHDVLGA